MSNYAHDGDLTHDVWVYRELEQARRMRRSMLLSARRANHKAREYRQMAAESWRCEGEREMCKSISEDATVKERRYRKFAACYGAKRGTVYGEV